MPQIDISPDLFQQIEQTLPPTGTVAGFVRAAIEDKLAWQDRRDEFFRLSDGTRRAMHERGLTEERLLAEFDARRHGPAAE